MKKTLHIYEKDRQKIIAKKQNISTTALKYIESYNNNNIEYAKKIAKPAKHR